MCCNFEVRLKARKQNFANFFYFKSSTCSSSTLLPVVNESFVTLVTFRGYDFIQKALDDTMNNDIFFRLFLGFSNCG